MPTYKKKNESQIVSACLVYLKLQQKMGRLINVSRVLSGNVRAGRYMVRGAQKGTPDIMAIDINGNMLWVEVKKPGGKLTEEQIVFKEQVKTFSNHVHIVAESTDDLHEYFERRSWI